MLAECARVLLKRWPWVAVALVVTLVVGAGVYKTVAPGQESKAQVLLVPSITQPGVNGPTNPFNNLGGSMAVAASVVQVAVTDQKVAQALLNEGARASYSVQPNLAENAGPVLLVTADDPSATMAQRTLSAVIDQIKQQLLQLQVSRNIPNDLLINAVVLTATTHAKPVHKAQVQKAVLATLAVLVILIMLILLADRRSRRRAQRAARQRDVENGWGEAHYRGEHHQLPQPPVTPRRRLRRRGSRKTGVPGERATDGVARSDESDDILATALDERILATSERPD